MPVAVSPEVSYAVAFDRLEDIGHILQLTLDSNLDREFEQRSLPARSRKK